MPNNSQRGVGGRSVAQVVRDSFSGYINGPSTVLNATFGSEDTIANFDDLSYFPTQNRWRGKIGSERILFEGTSGSVRMGSSASSLGSDNSLSNTGGYVEVVYRGIDGTNPIQHEAGETIDYVIPDVSYGVNLTTYEKGQYIYPSDWTSGGIQGINIVPQTQTVRVLSTNPRIMNGIPYYSGQVYLFDPSKMLDAAPGTITSFSPYVPYEYAWLYERNEDPVLLGKYYDGQFAGYSTEVGFDESGSSGSSGSGGGGGSGDLSTSFNLSVDYLVDIEAQFNSLGFPDIAQQFNNLNMQNDFNQVSNLLNLGYEITSSTVQTFISDIETEFNNASFLVETDIDPDIAAIFVDISNELHTYTTQDDFNAFGAQMIDIGNMLQDLSDATTDYTDVGNDFIAIGNLFNGTSGGGGGTSGPTIQAPQPIYLINVCEPAAGGGGGSGGSEPSGSGSSNPSDGSGSSGSSGSSSSSSGSSSSSSESPSSSVGSVGRLPCCPTGSLAFLPSVLHAQFTEGLPACLFTGGGGIQHTYVLTFDGTFLPAQWKWSTGGYITTDCVASTGYKATLKMDFICGTESEAFQINVDFRDEFGNPVTFPVAWSKIADTVDCVTPFFTFLKNNLVPHPTTIVTA